MCVMYIREQDESSTYLIFILLFVIVGSDTGVCGLVSELLFLALCLVVDILHFPIFPTVYEHKLCHIITEQKKIFNVKSEN